MSSSEQPRVGVEVPVVGAREETRRITPRPEVHVDERCSRVGSGCRSGTRDVTITTGAVDTSSTPTLLRLLASRHIGEQRFVTHPYGFDEFMHACDVSANAAETAALKVVPSRAS